MKRKLKKYFNILLIKKYVFKNILHYTKKTIRFNVRKTVTIVSYNETSNMSAYPIRNLPFHFSNQRKKKYTVTEKQ